MLLITLLCMAIVASVSWVITGMVAEDAAVALGIDHPTARFWSWISLGNTLAALGLWIAAFVVPLQ